MVLLLIVVNAVILLALAALWESWRAARRSLEPVADGQASLRVSCRPAARHLVDDLVEAVGPVPGTIAPPVRGDRALLVEAPSELIGDLRRRLVQAALDDGFRIRTDEEDIVALRRGLRWLQVEVREGRGSGRSAVDQA